MKKITNSFAGVLFGFILIVVGVVLLFSNEKNNVKNIAVVDELRNVAIDTSSSSVDSINDGKLVAISGKLEMASPIQDTTFGVRVESAKLVRTVEMYQYVESCTTDDNDKRTCNYLKEWREELVDDTKFENKGYVNPTTMPYETKKFVANSGKVGAYIISEDTLAQLNTDTVYTNYTHIPSGYSKNGEYLVNSRDLENPQIGDVRIRFTYNASDTISVLAKQSGNTLVNYVTKEGKVIHYVSSGTKDSKELINEIQDANHFLKWIVRGLALFIEMMGVALLFKPITTISSYVPIFGSLVGKATAMVSFLFGLIITLLFTAIAWMTYRPILGIGLIIAVIILFVIVKKISKR